MVNFDGSRSKEGGEMATTKHHDLHLKKDIAVPKTDGSVQQPAAAQKVNHPLTMHQARVPTVKDWLKHHELLGGNAHSEQLAKELFTSSQINRGPPGTYSGSNLHFQMLTGQDERIGFDFGDANW